tara:strand:- start:387 stop:911 length:525 start_codon:yes stop_codon:yes gene_type:complete
MAKINFDIAKKLDITCRRGDSFSLELTLKDSSGIPINLWGAEGTATFHMIALTPDGKTTVFATSGMAVPPGSVSGGVDAFIIFIPSITDDVNTTTADTTDAAYDATTAATGIVKFEATALEMKLPALIPFPNNLVYDIQYVDQAAANQVDSADNARTILYGNIFMKDDISIIAS